MELGINIVDEIVAIFFFFFFFLFVFFAELMARRGHIVDVSVAPFRPGVLNLTVFFRFQSLTLTYFLPVSYLLYSLVTLYSFSKCEHFSLFSDTVFPSKSPNLNLKQIISSLLHFSLKCFVFICCPFCCFFFLLKLVIAAAESEGTTMRSHLTSC